MECLVRWRHPNNGILLPENFLAVARNCQIIDIGKRVICLATKQLSTWKEIHELPEGFSISINLSGKQLLDPEVYYELAGCLQRFDLDPKEVNVEVTEDLLVEDPAQAEEAIVRYTTLGIILILTILVRAILPYLY